MDEDNEQVAQDEDKPVVRDEKAVQEERSRKIREILDALENRLSKMPPEEIDRLHGKMRKLTSYAGDMAAPEETGPPSHKDIRFPVIVGGRRFVARGFLSDGEDSIPWNLMFTRVRVAEKETRPLDEEELKHFRRHLDDLAKYPEFGYSQYTAVPEFLGLSADGETIMLSGFFYCNGSWSEIWRPADTASIPTRGTLVVSRCL